MTMTISSRRGPVVAAAFLVATMFVVLGSVKSLVHLHTSPHSDIDDEGTQAVSLQDLKLIRGSRRTPPQQQQHTHRSLVDDPEPDVGVCPADRLLVNWMKNAETCPAVFVVAQSVQEVQTIVRDTTTYPSPVRPAGLLLSPSQILENDGGTTVSLTGLNTIHGLVQIKLPSGQRVTCIDTDPGVSLREIQQYAIRRGKELPFSAEIGSSTVGGTAFTTTKDSAIGNSPVPGMGIGDVGSCVFAVTVVEDDGELYEYRLLDDNGNFDEKFQRLLDSQGTQGIAVRLLLTVRPITPVTVTIDVFRIKDGLSMATTLFDKITAAQALEGNVFSGISVSSESVYAEERIPTANSDRFVVPVLNRFLGKLILVQLKREAIQAGLGAAGLALVSFISGSPFLRFRFQSRPPGNAYDLDLSVDDPKLTFTYLSFPFGNFIDIVTDGYNFVKDYEQRTGFAPTSVAIYVSSNSGQRVAGPYATGIGQAFSFDATNDNPLDPRWDAFLEEFHAWAISKGARPSLNQTPGIEKYLEWGSTALSDIPVPRFTSPWLQQFEDAK